MLDKYKQELDKLMDDYQRDRNISLAKRKEEEATEASFNIEFERVKHEVVWPVIVDIGNELTHYGHDFQVTEEEKYIDATATYHPASITFSIYPASMEVNLRKPESAPYVSFVADPYAKMVSVSVSTMMPGTGGVAGEHGRYPIEKITSEFVQQEIIEVLKNLPIFNKD